LKGNRKRRLKANAREQARIEDLAATYQAKYPELGHLVAKVLEDCGDGKPLESGGDQERLTGASSALAEVCRFAGYVRRRRLTATR
jgi:hypothetical protein